MGAPVQGIPGVPMGGLGPPPPFEEMLDLLRQDRLAQTACIEQQREIMRCMRGLSQWLERDSRDRRVELQSIGARVDALREELLGRLGSQPAGMPMHMPMPIPPAEPGHPQGPSGTMWHRKGKGRIAFPWGKRLF